VGGTGPDEASSKALKTADDGRVWQPLLLFILNLTFLIQVVLSATLSRLYCVLGDFHVSIDTLVQNFSRAFWFVSLFYWH